MFDSTKATATYDLVDAVALAIAFAWSNKEVSPANQTATTRQDTFKLAQGFRAQIADEQIHYDINQFATISSPTLEDERSSLLAGLDNMIYTDDAQAGTSTADDFHTVANFQTVDERSSGAGWLSYLGSRIVAHSIREDTSNLDERRMVVFGGADARAPGMIVPESHNITDLSSGAISTEMEVQQADASRVLRLHRRGCRCRGCNAHARASAAKGRDQWEGGSAASPVALKYINAVPDSSTTKIARQTVSVGESPVTTNEKPGATYADDEVRMM